METKLKEYLKKSPFTKKQIYELCRPFGYVHQEAQKNKDVIQEAIRQVIQLYYDVNEVAQLIRAIEEGRIKAIERNLTSLSKFIFSPLYKTSIECYA